MPNLINSNIKPGLKSESTWTPFLKTIVVS